MIKLKNQAKTIASVITLASVTFLFLFMNCSLSEDFLNQGSSGKTGKDLPPYVYTDPNPEGGFPDPDDPKTKNNIKWLHGNANISEWDRTSKITPPDIEIKLENGQVCITHSKAGQWPPKSAQAKVDPIVTEPVEGNPWIIVPINGKGYAATYDWLRAGEPCHMLDVESLEKLYNSDKSFGKRTHKSPLTKWIPIPGDKVGLMVSGLIRNEVRNVQERSNMLIVTLPDKSGDIPQAVEEPCSQDPNSSSCPKNCNISDRTTVIKAIATTYQDASAKAYELRNNYIADGPASIKNDDLRWEFMDRVVTRLNSTDKRWGYTCNRKNCSDISTDTIAYACGSGDPSESERIKTVQIIGESHTLSWTPLHDPDAENEEDDDGNDASDRDTGGETKSGAGDVGDGTGNVGSGGDAGDGGGDAGDGAGDPATQGSRAIAMSTDSEEDPGPGWLFPRPGARDFRCSHDDHAPSSQLDLVRRVAAKTGNLYKTDVNKFTEHVAECLKAQNNNWGRHVRDSGFTSNNIVAFAHDTGNANPYSVSIVRRTEEGEDGDPQLQWVVQENSSGLCGNVGGTWQAVQGDCILVEEDEGEPCPKNLVDAGTHITVKGKCLPFCTAFAKTNAPGVEIGIGDLCDDTTNYNILEIKGTVEGSQDDPKKCCRRSDKRSCPTDYQYARKEREEGCFPYCNKAAQLSGYSRGYLHDKGLLRSDSCRARSQRDFSFYDPYNFRSLNSTKVYEVLSSDTGFRSKNYYCCVRGIQRQVQQGYDSKGWHPDDKTTSGTSTVTTTSSSTSSTSSSQISDPSATEECVEDLCF